LEEPGHAQTLVVLVAVSLATFMTYLDNNVTNVAIPTIQRDLHLSVASLEWVGQQLHPRFAGLLLAGGAWPTCSAPAALLTGLTVFTLASLGAGLAGSGTVLIAARLVQGLGAALVVPTTLAIIMATFKDPGAHDRDQHLDRDRRDGARLRPAHRGFISQHLHWGWIFFINVPVGVAAFAIANGGTDDPGTPQSCGASTSPA